LSTWNSCVCHPYIIFGDAWRDQPSSEVGIGCAKLEQDHEHPALRWSLFSRRDPPPWPSYSGTLRLTFSPSFSVLLRRVSSLGNWGKAPSPLQLNGRQSEETQMPGGGLCHTANAMWAEPDFSVPRLFLFFSI
jgi:hypothetical protein